VEWYPVPNRLANETSPYLRQHADNPVDWYPWGEEAFRIAQEQDKPILLSIGYAACHWCHVMAHECFENPDIARLMNERFVCIKVDREERPDIDALYMSAVQAMTGQGGWPLTVFLTPDGRPFYGGTYFPPEDRPGLPGFPRVLLAVSETYRTRRAEVERAASDLVHFLNQQFALTLPTSTLTSTLLDEAARNLVPEFDREHGGFGTAPKFPAPTTLEFLLRTFRRVGSQRAREMVTFSLEHMIRGGIYDHIGGGFHRYAVDAAWEIPHFEKMLYDNAQLSRLLVLAYQASGNPLFRRTATETLDYVLRELRLPGGGFASTQDADVEGEEGKFYTWTTEELEEALGPQLFSVAQQYFGLRPEGNFEGKHVLHVPNPPEHVAAALGIGQEELMAQVAAIRSRLFALREQRPHPARDEKVLTSWNGLLLQALAEAATVLGEPTYAEAAVQLAAFLRDHLAEGDAHLWHVFADGQAKVTGLLEDYAYLARGLLALYELTFDRQWLHWARRLTETILREFRDPATGDFFDTTEHADHLVARPKSLFDSPTPSPIAVTADVFLRLSLLFGDGRYEEYARTVLERYAPLASEHPTGMSQFLLVLDFLLAEPFEIALVGNPEQPDMAALLKVVREPYVPAKVVALRRPHEYDESIPLLLDRPQKNGTATAYVCRHFVCQQPVTTPAELARQLGLDDRDFTSVRE